MLFRSVIPLKIVSGGESVNLQASTTTIKYISNSKSFDDIYAGPITTSTYANATAAFTQATAETGTDFDAFNTPAHPVLDALPSSTSAVIYWSVRTNTNAILDQGEHANLAIGYSNNDRPAALDKIRVEVLTATGAALTVERNVPNITTTVVDLG